MIADLTVTNSNLQFSHKLSLIRGFTEVGIADLMYLNSDLQQSNTGRALGQPLHGLL